jgi:phage terminase large subunit-like protein
MIREDSTWHFTRLEQPSASWITADRLDEQRRLLPAVAFDRLWLNRWTATGGDAICEDDLDAGFDDALSMQEYAETGHTYAVGVDLSINRDHTAIVVVGKDKQGRYRVAQCRHWRPTNRSKIDLEAVENTIIQINANFKPQVIAVDNYQAEHLCQRLQKRGIRITAVPQTTSALVGQCGMLIDCFTSQAISIPKHSGLRHDLRTLRVEQKSYGMRLMSVRDPETGHGDLVSALGGISRSQEAQSVGG